MMDISDLDCPQYVCFESETFQREDREKSMESNDMQSVSDKEMEKSESDAEQSHMEQSTLEEMNEESCYRSEDFEIIKENISTNQFKELPNCKAKSAFKKPTIPQPFQFQTDNRVKSKPSNFDYKEENFASKLRQNTAVQSKKNHLTKVQPFHLTEGKKRKHTEEYKSLAEQVAAFQKKTPERYHTSHKTFQPPEHWEPPPLTAKSPELQAMKRRRVVNALSKEELEEKELQEMKTYEFHARPVDPKIYIPPSTNEAQCKLTTKNKKTYLKGGEKSTFRRQHKMPEKNYKFKARPVPTNILSGPVGIKEKLVIPRTEPKSPTFEVENRIEKRRLLESKRPEPKVQHKKVPKQPTSGPPSIPWVKKPTQVQPFSFDKIDQERFLQKERKIQEEIEKEKKAHTFHAQLMPSPAQSVLPAVERKLPTNPKPFNFMLENRSTKQLPASPEKIIFKAQPATVLEKKPFIPEKPPKLEIEIQEFTLHTDRRASERQQLNQLKEAEEQEKGKVLQLQKAENEEREKKELMKLRREIVHKANPIRQYKQLEIKPSSLPLTLPESPEFETDKRLKEKH